MTPSFSLFRAVRYSILDRVNYSLCCPPRPPPGGCGGCRPGPGSGPIDNPPKCSPGRIAPNPCCPRFHPTGGSWKKYRLIFFLAIPLIVAQMFHAFNQHPPPKGECRDFEYMRRRTKRFPWGGSKGDGSESLFHNPHMNHLPGECTEPPLDCD